MQYIFNYLAVQCIRARLICSLCYGALLKNMYKVIEKVCQIIFITTIVIGGYCLFWLTLLVRCSMTKWLKISKILEVVQKFVPKPCGNISPSRLTVWYLFNVIPSPSFYIKREKLLLVFESNLEFQHRTAFGFCPAAGRGQRGTPWFALSNSFLSVTFWHFCGGLLMRKRFLLPGWMTD